MLPVLLLVALAPTLRAALDVRPKPLLFYVDNGAALSRPKLLSAQPTQVFPRQAPGRFVFPGRPPSPIVPEESVNPGSIYHQRVYHNQQKLPLLRPAQGAPRDTFFAGAPRALPPISRNQRPADENEDEEEEEPENLEEEEDAEDESSAAEEDEAPEEEEESEEEEDSEDAPREQFFNPQKFRQFRYESDKEDAEDTDESKQSFQRQRAPWQGRPQGKRATGEGATSPKLH